MIDIETETDAEVRHHALQAMTCAEAVEHVVSAQDVGARTAALIELGELSHWGALYSGLMLRIISEVCGPELVRDAAASTLRILGGDGYRAATMASVRGYRL